MMGAGKTSVGAKIAEYTNRPHYDTDAIIQNRYGDISQLFQTNGEAYFRMRESKITQELACLDNAVISTGGGLVVDKENARLLKQNGVLVYLRANAQTIFSRLQNQNHRPLLQGDKQKKITALLSQRAPVYERLADIIIDVDCLTVDDTAKQILRYIEKYKINKA